MMCFTADLYFVLNVFQKKKKNLRAILSQIDTEVEAERFQKTMDNLNEGKLLGGLEEAFEEKFDEKSNTVCYIKLLKKTRRSSGANLDVTDHREFSAIRNESISATKQFID